jgi:phospholipid transport system substrate-binding protein
MRLIFYPIVFLLIFSQLAIADNTDDVKQFMKEKINIVTKLLSDKTIDKETRNNKIIEAITPVFDFPTMARLSLGKRYWKQLNKKKQEEFSALFVKRLENFYLEKLDLYTDEKVLVEDAKQVKKNRIYLLTHIVTKDDKKEMLYKLYRSKQGWKIYDIAFLGVSVVQTYRSQFSGILKVESFDDLLEKLKTGDELAIPKEKL